VYLREVLRRLFELYDAWGEPDRAEMFRPPDPPAPEESGP
jgi:hypothetical protein